MLVDKEYYNRFPITLKNALCSKMVSFPDNLKEYGPIDEDDKTSHINLYLFNGIDPSDEFEVVEKWAKNG